MQLTPEQWADVRTALLIAAAEADRLATTVNHGEIFALMNRKKWDFKRLEQYIGERTEQ